VLCYLWLLTGIVEILDSVLLAVHASLTRTELWLGLGGILAATLTPMIFWIRHLRRRVWAHSVRALELAKGMRSFVGVGVATYGVGMLLFRLTDAVVGMERITTRGYVDVFPFALSVLVGLGSWLWYFLERRNTRWLPR
jgi:hypothetical protein